MDEAKILKLVYTFFLGLLLALFVGFGTNTFYTAPVAPEYPASLDTLGKELTTKQIEVQNSYEKQSRDFETKKMQPYHRNVSVITLVAAVILLVISLIVEKGKAHIINGGIMLGGLFTLFYGLMRGFASQDSKYSFVAVSVGLVIVLLLGYRRFSDKQRPTTK